MGHEAGRVTPAAGIGAEEPICSPGAIVAERDPLATAHPAVGTGRAGGIDAPGDASEHRLHHDPGSAGSPPGRSLVHDAHHFVGRERRGSFTMPSK